MACFLSIDGRYILDRYRYLSNRAREPGFEFDQIIAQLQSVGGNSRHIENDFAIADELARDLGSLINQDREIRAEAAVLAPLVDGSKEVGLGRQLSHGCAGRPVDETAARRSDKA